ncbi:unnamed protein product, partial [Ectocarpus sp. 6 AP-2014]
RCPTTACGGAAVELSTRAACPQALPGESSTQQLLPSSVVVVPVPVCWVALSSCVSTASWKSSCAYSGADGGAPASLPWLALPAGGGSPSSAPSRSSFSQSSFIGGEPQGSPSVAGAVDTAVAVAFCVLRALPTR